MFYPPRDVSGELIRVCPLSGESSKTVCTMHFSCFFRNDAQKLAASEDRNNVSSSDASSGKAHIYARLGSRSRFCVLCSVEFDSRVRDKNFCYYFFLFLSRALYKV